MKATFTGRNKSGYVEYWGYRFPCGEAVEVEGEAVEAARRHPEFEVSEASSGKYKTLDDLDVEEAAKAEMAKFDHDGDGKPGGSKPKRKYTRRAK